MPSADLPPESSLGAYRIHRLLGRGGMGVVYEAEDARLGRRVALKVIARDLVADPSMAERFQREARAAAAVDHPGVARVHDVGTDRGATFVAFELVTGGSLGARLASRGALPWREVAELGGGIARALAAVHAAGLVHRDLKPDNVLLDREGRPKLADFGLARSRQPGLRSLTATGELVGTSEFMAPEQIEDAKRVDGRADLYALGATLFALLVGRPPFEGSGLAQIKKQLLEKPVSLRAHVPDLPRSFDALVLRLLEKDPDARPRDAAQVAAELEQIARGVPDAKTRRWPWAVAAAVPVVAVAALFLVRAPGHPSAPAPRASPASPAPVARPSTKPTTSPAGSLAPSPPRAPRPASWIAHAGGAHALAVSHDGKTLFSGGADGLVKEWDPETGQEVRRLEGHAKEVIRVVISTDGHRALTTGSDSTTRLWDLASRTCVLVLETPMVHALAFSRDGARAVTGSWDNTLRLFDLANGSELKTITFEQNVEVAHWPVFAGPDRVLAIMESGRLAVCDFERASFQPIRTAHAAPAYGLDASADGQRILTGGNDGLVKVWDILREDPVHVLTGHVGAVIWVALSPSGKRALSGGADRTARLWDVEAGKQIAALEGHEAAVVAVAFSRDGQRGFSSSKDGTIRSWDLPPEGR